MKINIHLICVIAREIIVVLEHIILTARRLKDAFSPNLCIRNRWETCAMTMGEAATMDLGMSGLVACSRWKRKVIYIPVESFAGITSSRNSKHWRNLLSRHKQSLAAAPTRKKLLKLISCLSLFTNFCAVS